MTEPGCEQFRQESAELALGVLPGRERADAIAHLEHCPGCREELQRLAEVSDQLVQLIPGADAPLGFESRVMARLGFSSAARRRAQPRWLAAAVVAVLVAGLAGWSMGHRSTSVSHRASGVLGAPAAVPPLRSASFVVDGHTAGTVFAYQGRPWWVYMAVEADRAEASISCQLVRRDGTVAALGTFPLTNGYGYWGGPSPVDPVLLAAARLVTADGRILATAQFTAGGPAGA